MGQRVSRFQKRQQIKKDMLEKIKEKGADTVYSSKPYVQSQKQIWRHGVRDYSDGKSIATKVDSNLTNATIDKNQVIPNGVNQADVENGLELTLTLPAQDIKPVPRITNPLHKYESVNCVFTLAALTLDEVNFPDTTIMVRPPEYIVAKSAGGSARETTLMEGGKLEFYIDNVQIDAIVHSNTATGHTQGTNISFTVHEPFSLGLFLQNLQYQVAQASNTDNSANMANYLTHPMVLISEFVGVASEDLTPTEKRQLRKVMPIQLKTVNFGNSNGISTYEVKAMALNDIAFSDQYARIPYDVEISGETVSEVLWSGEKSLANLLNNKEIELIKEYKKTKAYKRAAARHGKTRANQKAERSVTLKQMKNLRDYMFIFPEDSGLASRLISKGAQDTPNKIAQGDFDEGTQVPYQIRLTGIFNYLFDENFSYTLGKGFTGEELYQNKIGQSKMIIKHLENAGDTGKEFPDENADENTYFNKDTKTNITGVAKVNTKTKTISFKKDTHITQIIEEVILLSEYGQDLKIRKLEAESGMINWFKVVPARYMFTDAKLQQDYNANPEILMYRVIEYQVPDDKFMAPDDVSRVDMLDALIRKEYNILYTGQNKDVIDFNVEFNNAFYTALMNDLGNVSPNSVDQSQSSVESEKEVVSKDSSTSEYSGNSINQQVAFGDPQNVDGGNAETVELRIARQFNKAILDSDVDLVKMDLNIVGDPYYIPQSAFGNYIASSIESQTKNQEVAQEKFKDVDGNANYLKSVVLTKINFRTPLDISDGKGNMIFYKDKVAENQLQTLGEFSGYYYPVRVISSFANNKFTQELELIRNKTGVIGADKNTRTENKDVLSKSPEKQDSKQISEEILPNNGFIGEGNDMGEGAP